MIGKKIVTIYIDDSSIRLLVTEGDKIKKWADLPIEAGLVKGTVILKEDELANKIRQLLRAQRINTNKVVLGFSGLHSMTRPINLPDMPKSVQNEAVMRAAKKLLPIPLEQLYLSWQTVPTASGSMQAFVIAVPNRTTDSFIKTLRSAGLGVSQMSIKPMVLTRAVRDSTAIVLDVQPTEFDIIIISDGIPHPVRTVALPDDAHSWAEKLPVIINDLDRTMKFFNSNNPAKPLNEDVPILVSGIVYNSPDVQQALAEACGHKIIPLRSPLEIPDQLDLSRFMVNVTLSCMESEKDRVSLSNLNVLPAKYQPKPFSFTRFMTAPSAAVVLVLVGPLLYLNLTASSNINTSNMELENINRQITLKQAESKELSKDIEDLGNRIAAMKAFTSTIDDAMKVVRNQQIALNSELSLVVGAVPQNVTLTGISGKEGKLTVNGEASVATEVLVYANNLKSSGRYSEVIVSSIKDTDKALTFTLLLIGKD